MKLPHPQGPSTSEGDSSPDGARESGAGAAGRGGSGDLFGGSGGREFSVWVPAGKAGTSTGEGDAETRRGVSGLELRKAGFSMPAPRFMVRTGSPLQSV